MINKYVRVLKAREINSSTGSIWSIYDVPSLWRDDVIKQIEADGYNIDFDGTVNPIY